MLLEKERNDVVEYCKKLITSGLTKGTGGNISIYNQEEKLLAISPSGMDYFEMTPEDVTILSPEGKIVDGKRKPSSEWQMHSIFYNKRDDITSVVHTHSTYCTVLATIRQPLPASSYLVAFAGTDVRCSRYEQFGSSELANAAFEGMEDRKAVLLANHGLLAGGGSIAQAFTIAEEIEFCAQVYVAAKSIGTPVLLENEEMLSLIEKFKHYGQ